MELGFLWVAKNVAEQLAAIVLAFDAWHVGNAIIALLFVAAASILFLVRRTHDLRLEVWRRKAAENTTAELTRQTLADGMAERGLLVEAVRANEQRLQCILETAHQSIITIDHLDVISGWNRHAELTFGWNADEVIGRRLSEIIIPPSLRAAHNAGLSRFMSSRTARLIGSQIEVEALRRNGDVFPIELALSATNVGDEWQFTALIQDISERRAHARALAAREQELQLVMTHSADMIVRTGIDRVRRYVSPRSRTLLGYEPEEITNQAPFYGIHPDDLAAVEARSTQALETAGPAHSIYRQRHRDGHYVWVEANFSAVRDEATGEPLEFIASVRDFGARMQLEEELHAARARAEDAARLKAAFLANMSHEIRTPMNGVIGFTELLLGSELSTEQHRYASLISESGRTMMALLNDILDLSKIDANQIEIVEEAFDVPHMISGSVRMIAASAAAKKLSIDLAIDRNIPAWGMGDSHRIRQILLNLLSNAIKFTEVGVIRLSAAMNGDVMEIMVEDTGSGIPTDRQASIFEEFVQGDASTARRHGGTGLGLAISQRLARLMDGDICLAKSDANGTRLQVSIPLRPVEAGAVPSSKLATKPLGPPTGGLRILVAEDVEINQLLIDALLTRHGHEVHLVSDGAQAIEALAADHAYDIVLMDMQMPQVDGLEATRRIRALGGAGATIPIIALTANAFASDAEVCRAAGMNAYLSKPIDFDAVIATIARLTNGRSRPARAVATQNSAVTVPSEDPAITALRDRYEALKLTYATELRRLEVLLLGEPDEATRVAVCRTIAELCHKLAGSAGMFGDADLGDAALQLEIDALSGEVGNAVVTATRTLAARLARAA